MIVGAFFRYFKTYQGVNFVPITDQGNFCGLLGENGIGKSSVLEAFDCFFNNKQWNMNIATKKSGLAKTKPYIVPVFLVEKSSLSGVNYELADTLNNIAIELSEDDVPSANREDFRSYSELLNRVRRNYDLEGYFVLPLGIDHLSQPNVSIFNCNRFGVMIYGDDYDDNSVNEEGLERFKPLLDVLKKSVEYIYIPKEIDPELFTRLETNEIQVLMGETLHEILEQRVTQAQIRDINNSLNEFINSLASELDGYSYRTPTDRQQNLRKNDVYNLIIEAFFNIRKLHKREGYHWLEIGELSSGEKQKAIIDVAHKLLLHHRNSGNNLIIGIDEPESSLHMSACFDQFDAIYEISKSCKQVLFSSHWYGFLPTIESGSATVITKKDNNHVFDLVNLVNYREQVKQMSRESRKRLPYDIRLKSINDFVQSVITSAIGEKPFSWIICEGTSERIYLEYYFKDLVQENRLRIVPVGGAGEIKRLYNHLSTSYEDFKEDITGNIVLISDTDSQLVSYDTKNFDKLRCKRIVNCEV
ncbi:putative ATP-dependent endonuclease of OLD family [Modicisalibacter xianhensis]|uniref:Putative ATP-dependent endonuclease of OLD family n=1 Tax=Modicisalibacter xianhensis TaxID=442341 RepID=A0A4R8FMP5_9GAMM|nr:AAA family ATPase [Halomonas xianhensis]TDX27574.1 putative ATP-dependent endonuclease of OLD family [Halomonas xianhensis]